MGFIMSRRLIRRSSRGLAVLAAVAGLGYYTAARTTASGTITISGCASPCVVKAGPDFATDTFADPWDFSERTDVATDPAQFPGIANFSLTGGVFSGTANDSGGNFAVLEQPWPNMINPGKTGRKFPINTSQYTKLAVKMNLSAAQFARIYWFHNDITQGGAGWRFFDPVTAIPSGNGIYVIDLSQPPQPSQSQGVPWTSGNVEGLVFYPNSSGTPVDFSFDWVRLTAGDSSASAAKMSFSWSGTSGGDVKVTENASGVSYTIQKNAAATGSVSNWNYGILPPGQYTLTVGSTMQTTFTINAPPLIHITEPDQSGGADFATDVLRNPWDMNDLSDVVHGVNIVPHVINESANGIYTATSDGQVMNYVGNIPVGDPQVYLLSNQRTSNTADIIDTTKYHRVTFDMTIDRAFDLGRGSIARVFWGSNSSDTAPGGTPYQVTLTQDIIMWPGTNTYTVDLSTLTSGNGIEPGSLGIPWSQQPVRHFRIDPFEFGEPVTFHVDNVKLAADDETTNSKFTIKWTGSDADAGDTPVVALYYQATNGAPVLITGNVPMSAGQYVWDTTGVPNGTYSILAVASDAYNQSAPQSSTGPLKVSSNAAPSNPQIGVDTPTPNQVVTSSFEIFGWLLDAGAPTGTGVDAVKIYVQLPGAPAPGVFIGNGRLGLSRPDVAGLFGSQFINSGFHFTITGLSPGAGTLWVIGHSTVSNTDSITKSVPFTVSATGLMSIDIPSSESFISDSSFGVSGWAIDRSVEGTAQSGTGIDQVVVYAFHNPGSGEPAVYLGEASYGGIQRSDVAAFYGSRYQNSGYLFIVDRAAAGLGTGEYNIVTIAHNTITNSYDNLAIVRVVLQ